MALTKSGCFVAAGGGKAGALVDMWLASRFPAPPAENSAPPSGSPDAGPVTTGMNFGSPGSYLITVPTLADYWVRVQYGGVSYWSQCPLNTIMGAPAVQGPVGPTGATGATGATGPTGPAGPTYSPTWATYTPTWSASTPPTIGNGTITGRWTQAGKLVSVYLRIVAGTTTTAGSGIYLIGLPVAAVTSPIVAQRLLAQGVGPSGNWVGYAVTNAGICSALSTYGNTALAVVDNTFMAGTNDEINITGTYESV